MPLLRLNKASLNFGPRILLDEVDLTLKKGNRIGLLGRNGEGKTTLFKVIAGILAVDGGEHWLRPGIKVSWLDQVLPIGDDQTVFDAVADGLGEVGDGIGLAELGLDLGREEDVRGQGITSQADIAHSLAELGLDLGEGGSVGEHGTLASAADGQLLPLESAWNAHIRRAGDMTGSVTPSNFRAWTHGNTYLMDAVVRSAFCWQQHRAWGSNQSRVGINETHRELEGVLNVAALAHLDYRAKGRMLLEHLRSIEKPTVCMVQRSFDGTPSFHSFGSFPDLAKRARYIKEIPAGTDGCAYARYTTQSFEELRADSSPLRTPLP